MLFETEKCGAGCAVDVTGRGIEKGKAKAKGKFEELFCPNSECKQRNPLVEIKNVSFSGIAKYSIGEFFSFKDVNLSLDNSLFTSQSVGGLIYFEGFHITLKNITMDTAGVNDSVVSVLSIDDSISTHVEDVHIYCSIGSAVTEKAISTSHLISCRKKCDKDRYTFQAGSVILGWRSTEDEPKVLSSNRTIPSCLNCPAGANCDQFIKALPNHWGFRNLNDDVTMLRCPIGYCCTGNDTCKSIDSCSEGRKGILCGTCDQNLTESLLTSKCISVKHCSRRLVTMFYILGAMVYGIGLILMSYLKKSVPKILKNLYHSVKKRTKSSNLDDGLTDENQHENGNNETNQEAQPSSNEGEQNKTDVFEEGKAKYEEDRHTEITLSKRHSAADDLNTAEVTAEASTSKDKAKEHVKRSRQKRSGEKPKKVRASEAKQKSDLECKRAKRRTI